MRERWRDLRGRNVLITGGSRGLGLALAEVCARRGARVALLARDAQALRAAGEQIRRSTGSAAELVVCDLREPAAVEPAITGLLARWGRIDVLINNAGIIEIGAAEQQPLEAYEAALAVHFWAPLHAMRALIPALRAQGGGRIVNVSSLEGKVAFPQLSSSCASKFALTGLSNAMRAELARDRIYVTTVCPGLMHDARAPMPRAGARGFAWRAARSLLSVPYERAARRIIAACLRGSRWLELDPASKLLIRMDALAPRLTGALIERASRRAPRT